MAEKEPVASPLTGTLEEFEDRDHSYVAPDVIPEGGYGWVCVLSVFLVNSFTWGAAAQSYGIFLGYYLSSETFSGATSIDYAFVGGFNLCMAMVVAPLVTISSKQWGTHITMLIGIVLQTAGFVLASFTTAVWQLYITQGALVGFGIGFTYIPSTAVIPQWFLKRRALASALAAGGSGVGGIIYSFVTQALIDNVSIWWALRIVGITSGAMNLVATALIRDRNKSVKPTMHGFDTKLLKRTQPILLLSWIFVGMFGYTCLLYSLPDFALSIGLTSNQAAYISVFMNVSTTVGRAIVGILSDRLGIIPVSAFTTLFTGICTFAIWIPANSYAVTIVFALAVGGTLGVFWPAVAPLCATIAGLEELPSLLSLSWLISVVPLAFAEVIALKLRRPSMDDAYLYPQIMSGVSYLLASSLMFALWRVHRKHGQICKRGGTSGS